ncbi:hypothetical protein N7530_006214 [Penicillium desertorum]|uniref:RRM domain-containing protein n=1 Tax=Penicillium desertorum TaxID=1303715 RepID=A0A9W9WRC2_9EURO|nr:hypothetical protein N7530_006214 [Penicillium desertorum]
MRFAYLTITQTRLNSTTRDGQRIPIRYVESVQPPRPDQARLQKHERRRPFLTEGPIPKTTLYVGNLFFDVTAEDLRKHFEKYGAVENALIVHDARGLSKGFGYVTFSTIEEATEAITQQHGGILEGREVVVQFSNTTYRAMADTKPSKTDLVADLQGVTDVRIPVDRRTGLPRGFAHIDFIEQSNATHGKEVLSRKEPYGRKLSVSFARRKILSPEDFQRYQQKKLEKKKASGQTLDAQPKVESLSSVRKGSEVREVREVNEIGEGREVKEAEQVVEQTETEKKR